MMYNPTTVNAYEPDNWPSNTDDVETQHLSNDSVDWNIFTMESETVFSGNIGSNEDGSKQTAEILLHNSDHHTSYNDFLSSQY